MSEKELQIKGNVAVQPEIQEETIKKPEPKKRKVVKKLKPKKHKETSEKAGTLFTILFIFVLGFVTVFASSRVMLLKKKYNEKSAQLTMLQKENEDLNIKLVKFDNADYIESEAISRLQMRKAKIEEYVSVDLSKDNFNSEEAKENEGKLQMILNYILGR